MKKIVSRISNRLSRNSSTRNKLLHCFSNHMYLSVLKLPFDVKNCKHLKARAISLAACGDFEKAKETIELLMDSSLSCSSLYVRLSDALIPFMPKTAAKILEEV